MQHACMQIHNFLLPHNGITIVNVYISLFPPLNDNFVFNEIIIIIIIIITSFFVCLSFVCAPVLICIFSSVFL
jgi:hypothetical protein